VRQGRRSLSIYWMSVSMMEAREAFRVGYGAVQLMERAKCATISHFPSSVAVSRRGSVGGGGRCLGVSLNVPTYRLSQAFPCLLCAL
jgi:hypothetical protein